MSTLKNLWRTTPKQIGMLSGRSMDLVIPLFQWRIGNVLASSIRHNPLKSYLEEHQAVLTIPAQRALQRL
jgi:hypothetical protein